MIDFSRQEPILDHRKPAVWPVVLIGCGGIGSTFAPDLPLLLFEEFILFDGDVVAPHNLSNQPGFDRRDVGTNKARALARVLRRKGARRVLPSATMFESIIHSSVLEGIVVSAVDSMETTAGGPCGRREIWEAVKKKVSLVPFFIDGRLGGEMFDCYAFAPGNFDAAQAYEKTLFAQSEASTAACTEGAIIYVVRALAAEMQHQIAAWLRGERYSFRIARDFKLTGNPDAPVVLREFLE